MGNIALSITQLLLIIIHNSIAAMAMVFIGLQLLFLRLRSALDYNQYV